MFAVGSPKLASHPRSAIMPIRGYRQSRLPRAKLIGGDHLKCEQPEVEFESACKFASAFNRGSIKFLTNSLKLPLERVKRSDAKFFLVRSIA
jgi:ATP-dependent DNA ligase